ncbi:hypothetical protein H4R18_000363 [Coemansia javaensis]|uniref:Sel1 repeat family protein n=1 Tax=Coemansia javaensis TaxID=2761396 RepID=A0A9W8HGA2_9FUNG|nr:hypothetical protein H4R18_000363 [Coemansia javaensis]
MLARVHTGAARRRAAGGLQSRQLQDRAAQDPLSQGRLVQDPPRQGLPDGEETGGWAGGAIRVERRPFPAFPRSKAGAQGAGPSAEALQWALDRAGAEATTAAAVAGLAQGFADAAAAKDGGRALERWRARAVGELGGDARRITAVAKAWRRTARERGMAHALFKVAAEEGSVEAAYHYGVLLGLGELAVPGGRALGTRIIRQLAAIGHPPSQAVVADHCLAAGQRQAGLDLLLSAANHSAAAALRLGDAYRTQAPPDHAAAAHWYARAAERGLPQGYFMLGAMSARGDAPDHETAFRMFERAAAGGSVEAQYNVGVCCLAGRGTERNPRLAAEYWAMAAAQRFPPALLNLAALLLDGPGVPRNVPRARALLAIAADCDGPVRSEARARLARLDRERAETGCVIL